MIKKTTVATFKDGDYAGEYDWSGGIPLSVNETISVKRKDLELIYTLIDKKTTLEDLGDDQIVKTEYFLELIK